MWLNYQKSADVIVTPLIAIADEGLNVRRFTTLDKSKKLQRKQKTKYIDQLMEVEVELQGKSKVPSNSMVLPNRESVNDEAFDTSRLLEEVLERKNMLSALKRVISNKGSHGVDGMKIDELREHIQKHWNTIKAKLLETRYNPSPVRRVEIPKPDGGVRLLGIPTVQDRLIQQAIAQILSRIYEPSFSNNSFGFRPHRGAKDAIRKSKEYINQGNRWVVDMDLEKFFDKVNHDILMSKLEKKIKDRRLLTLIRKYLKSGILINGICITSEEGTPQGGVISPVLANIFLHYAFDVWMERNYPIAPFARYADDAIIHCKSEKEAKEIKEALNQRMKQCKLELHPDKTRIVYCKDEDRTEDYPITQFDFLGYTYKAVYIKCKDGKLRNNFIASASQKACKNLRDKIKELKLHKMSGSSINIIAKSINPIVRGWINYFGKYNVSALKYTIKCIESRIVRWAMNKYKHFRGRRQRAEKWLSELRNREPKLFAHWSYR